MLGAGMKRCDSASQGSDLIDVDFVALNALLEGDLLGQTHHLDGPFDDITLAIKAKPGSASNNRHNPEVNGRC